MKAKNFVLLIFFLMLSFATSLKAQESTTKKVNDQTGMGVRESMKNCMEEIASDKALSSVMMDRIMDNMKGDSVAMKQMVRKIIENPEMHGMMMKMMSKEGMREEIGEGMGERNMKDKMDHDHDMHDTIRKSLP